jgi:hypothetical protein
LYARVPAAGGLKNDPCNHVTSAAGLPRRSSTKRAPVIGKLLARISHAGGPVPAARVLIALLLCTMPVTARAQPWAEAYGTGDYGQAANLLHEIVIDSALRYLIPDDPAPARHLAALYSQGLGVERDPIAACTLAQWADMAAQNIRIPDGLPDPVAAYRQAVQENERFVSYHCGLLTDDERLAASRSLGCFAFGMPEQDLVAGRQTVRIGRQGLFLLDTQGRAAADPTDVFGCFMAIAAVRVRSIAPPPDAAPGVTGRHFVEVFGWLRNLPEHGERPAYTLHWTSHEIRTNAVEPVVLLEQVGAADGWPPPGRPPDLDIRLTLEMIRSGHVRWRIAGDPPKRGWIMRREEDTR